MWIRLGFVEGGVVVDVVLKRDLVMELGLVMKLFVRDIFYCCFYLLSLLLSLVVTQQNNCYIVYTTAGFSSISLEIHSH